VKTRNPRPVRPPKYLSVAEAAPIFGISEVTLYRAIRAGEFPAVKIRGRYCVPARAVKAMEDAAVDSGRLVDAASWRPEQTTPAADAIGGAQ
jgi:excisionase family DNA binding protein